jgi:hypothetical protein
MGGGGDYHCAGDGLARYGDGEYRIAAIAADPHVGPADVIWVVNVYQIAIAATPNSSARPRTGLSISKTGR